MEIIERKIRTLCKDKVSNNIIDSILSENKNELTTMSIQQFKASISMPIEYNEKDCKYSIFIYEEDDKINFDLLEHDSIGSKQLNSISYPPSVPN